MGGESFAPALLNARSERLSEGSRWRVDVHVGAGLAYRGLQVDAKEWQNAANEHSPRP